MKDNEFKTWTSAIAVGSMVLLPPALFAISLCYNWNVGWKIITFIAFVIDIIFVFNVMYDRYK